MGKTRLSRTAAIVVMTSALAWNLPVLAQDDAEDDAASVTLISGADAEDVLARGNKRPEALGPVAESNSK